MTMFNVQGPDGQTYPTDAPDAESAANAVREMYGAKQSGGGQMLDQNNRIAASAAFSPENDDPNLAQALDQNVNAEADVRGARSTLANSAALNLGDEAMGILGGGLAFINGRPFSEGYDFVTNRVRGDINRYAERHPVNAAALDVLGAVPSAAAAGIGMVTKGPAIARMGDAAVRSGLYAAEHGFASGTNLDDRLNRAATEGATGAVLGAGASAIGAGIGRVAGKKAAQTAAISRDLKGEAGAIYKSAREAGVKIKPQPLQLLEQGVKANLLKEGFRKGSAKATFKAVKELGDLAKSGQPIDLEDLHVTLKSLRKATQSGDKTSKAAAWEAINYVENWMQKVKPAQMVNGPNMTGREAIQLLNKAKGIWATQSKGERMAAVVQSAQNKSLGKGQAVFAEKLRQGFESMLNNPKRMQGFSADERKFIEQIVKGGKMGWLLNKIGLVAPGASLTANARAGAAAAAGYGILGPAGAAIPAAGMAAKGARNIATRGATRAGMANVLNEGAPGIDQAARQAAEGSSNMLLGTGSRVGAPRLPSPLEITIRPNAKVPAR